MRKKLTTKTVEALAPNGPKRFEVYDLILPGFGIRVSTNGHKSWFCAARVGSRLRRHTLGPLVTRHSSLFVICVRPQTPVELSHIAILLVSSMNPICATAVHTRLDQGAPIP